MVTMNSCFDVSNTHTQVWCHACWLLLWRRQFSETCSHCHVDQKSHEAFWWRLCDIRWMTLSSTLTWQMALFCYNGLCRQFGCLAFTYLCASTSLQPTCLSWPYSTWTQSTIPYVCERVNMSTLSDNTESGVHLLLLPEWVVLVCCVRTRLSIF